MNKACSWPVLPVDIPTLYLCINTDHTERENVVRLTRNRSRKKLIVNARARAVTLNVKKLRAKMLCKQQQQQPRNKQYIYVSNKVLNKISPIYKFKVT